MSLDVTLEGEEVESTCTCMQCGNQHIHKMRECLYESNITHNLTGMAHEAGIYKELWRPEELGITKASQLIERMETGLHILELDPARFEKFNAKNGWGTYKQFVLFVREYLQSCKQCPDATVSASR